MQFAALPHVGVEDRLENGLSRVGRAAEFLATLDRSKSRGSQSTGEQIRAFHRNCRRRPAPGCAGRQGHDESGETFQRISLRAKNSLADGWTVKRSPTRVTGADTPDAYHRHERNTPTIPTGCDS